MRQALFLALAANLLVVALSSAADTDLCKLSTSVNGKTLSYDLNVLTRKNGKGVPTNLHANWYTVETHEDDASLDGVDDYTYFFNMCGPLLNVPSFLSSRVSIFGNDIAVLQRVEPDDDTDDDDEADTQDQTDGYVLGRRQGAKGLHRLMDGDLRYAFAPAATHIQDSSDPKIWYNTSRHCDFRQTTILLFCADVGLGKPVFAYEGAQCDYVFVWNTCAACSTDTDVRKNCPAVTDVCTSAGQAGKVLLIIFISFLLTYLVLGCLYNRFVKGERGWEQIPNFSLWEYLAGLIIDGCEYVWTFVSCCCKKRNSKPAAPLKYQGLEDRNEDLDDDADDKLYDIGHQMTFAA